MLQRLLGNRLKAARVAFAGVILAHSSVVFAASCETILAEMAASNATHQGQRFRQSLSQLLGAFKDLDRAVTTQESLNAIKALRTKVMLLTEVLGVHSDFYGKELSPVLRNLGELSKKIAGAADAMHYSSTVPTLGILYPKTAELLARRAEKSREKLLEYLEKEGWTTTKRRALRDLVEGVASLEPLKLKKDRRLVAEAITDQLKQIRDREYPLEQVEEGLHALRKDIRVVLMMAQSAGGLVELEGRRNPVPSTEPLVTSWVADSKYAKPLFLDALPEVSEPIRLPKGPFLELVLAVEILGAAKDLHQISEVIADAMIESGEFSNRQQAYERASAMVQAAPLYQNLVGEVGELIGAGRRVGSSVLQPGGSVDATLDSVKAFRR